MIKILKRIKSSESALDCWRQLRQTRTDGQEFSCCTPCFGVFNSTDFTHHLKHYQQCPLTQNRLFYKNLDFDSTFSAFHCLLVHWTCSHLLFSALLVFGFFIYLRCVPRFSVVSWLAAGSNYFRVSTESPNWKKSRYRHVEVKMTFMILIFNVRYLWTFIRSLVWCCWSVLASLPAKPGHGPITATACPTWQPANQLSTTPAPTSNHTASLGFSTKGSTWQECEAC